jgi:hypothetical protein
MMEIKRSHKWIDMSMKVEERNFVLHISFNVCACQHHIHHLLPSQWRLLCLIQRYVRIPFLPPTTRSFFALDFLVKSSEMITTDGLI